MIRTSGKIITNSETYILKGVKSWHNSVWGNGYCFDSSELAIWFVETIDNEVTVTVEKVFNSKKDFIYEKE